MALQRQYISLPFSNGVDTKPDPKLLEAPALINLENGKMSTSGQIIKRNGYQSLSQTTVTNTTWALGEALGVFKDELLSFDQQQIAARASERAQFVVKDGVTPLTVNEVNVLQSANSYVNADYDFNQGIGVYAYQLVTGGVYASIYDAQSNTSIASEVVINSSANAVKPRVVASGSYIYVFYVNNTQVEYVRLSLSAPTIFGTSTVLASGSVSAARLYDVVKIDDSRIAIVTNPSATSIVYGVFTGSLATPSYTPDTTSIGVLATDALAVFVQPSTLNIYVVWNNGLLVRGFIGSIAQTTVRATVTISTQVEQQIVTAITGGFRNNSTSLDIFYHSRNDPSKSFLPAAVNTTTEQIDLAGQFFRSGERVRFTNSGGGLPAGLSAGVDYFVVWRSATAIAVATSLANAQTNTVVDITTQGTGTHTITSQANDPQRQTIWYAVLPQSASVTAGTIVERSTGLVSKAFNWQERLFVLTSFQSDLQGSYFLLEPLNTNRPLIAKCQQDLAGNIRTDNQLSVVTSAQEGSFQVACNPKIRISADNGMFTASTGVKKVVFNFLDENKYWNETVGNNCLISGGVVSMYDGVDAVELGFSVFPEGASFNLIDGGSLSTAGTLSSVAVYEWFDAQGQIHRSSPLLTALNITISGSNRQITYSIPTLRITNKVLRPPTIAIYSTELGGTVFYRVTSITAPTFNTVASDFVQITVNAVGAAGNEILYTSSGEVENIAPPAAQVIAKNKNRVAIIGLEDNTLLWFSKFSSTGKAVGFNSDFTKRVDGYGPLKCIYALDDKWVIWTANSVHFFSGDGPLDTGEQDTFTDVQLLTSDVGCDNQNSIVQTPVGLMFQSQKGIRLLGRDFSLSYIGAPVEAYNQERITSATLIEDANEVRFTTLNRCLVYDYVEDQWSTWTNFAAKDSITWQGQFHYLRASGGKIYREAPGFYKDENLNIRLLMETAWIKVQNVQNYQRVRRVAFLGDFKSDHILKISIGYDFEPYYSDFVEWNAATVLDVSFYGDEAFYGDDDFYGGETDSIYQVSVHIPRQKCQSIRFKIEDVVSGDSLQSYSISNMTLECGVKSGITKLRSEKTAG